MILLRSIKEFFCDEDYRELLIATFVIILFGSVVFHILEGWSYIDSLYFSVVTLTTVGYGDLSPQTDAGKMFTIFYILMGIGIIFAFINAIYHHYYDLTSRSTSLNTPNKIKEQED